MLLGLATLVAWADAPAAPSPEDAFTAATQLLQAGNDQQAADALQKYLADFPSDENVPAAMFNLGCAYANLGKLSQAADTFTKTLEKTTADEQVKLRAQVFFQLADCQSRQQAYEKAVSAYQSCLKLLTDDDADTKVQAQYGMATALTQLKREPEALLAYAQVLAIDPKHALAPWSVYGQGLIRLEQNNWDAAIALFAQGLSAYPTGEVTPSMQLALGTAYLQRGAAGKEPNRTRDLQKGEPLLTAVWSNDKLDPAMRRQAALALARMYPTQKQWDAAKTAYANALTGLDANAAEALGLRMECANMLFNAERYDDAAAAYAAVVQVEQADKVMRHEASFWLANSRYQLAAKAKSVAGDNAAIAALQLYLHDATATDANGARATLLLAATREDAAALGADTRVAALDSYLQLHKRWPQSPEAATTLDDLLRVVSSMTPDELAKVLPSLPDGPARWHATVYLAQQSLQAKQYQQVADTLTKLLKSKGSDATYLAQANLLLGMAELRLNKPADAIPALTQAIEKAQIDDQRDLARQDLTQAYRLTKQYARAVECAQALTKLPVSAKDPAAKAQVWIMRWQLLGQTCVEDKQYARVIDAYQHLLTDYPHAPEASDACVSCGWAAEMLNDPEKAETYYRKLLADYPSAAPAENTMLRLATLLSARKAYQAVIDLLCTFPPTSKQADQAVYQLAMAYQALGKADKALEQYAALATRYPKSPLAGECLARLGDAQMQGMKSSEAQQTLTRALAALPANSPLRPAVSFNRAICRLRLKSYADAVADFDVILTSAPKSDCAEGSAYWKGQALELQGKATAAPARAAYAGYLASYPDGAFALDASLGAGRAAFLAGDGAGATAALQETITQCKRTDLPAGLAERAKNVLPEAYFTLGQNAAAQQQYGDAITAYAAIDSCKLEPWYSRSLLETARCKARKGDLPGAQQTLQLLIKLLPQSDAAKQAPAVAKELKVTLE
jgi:TolA-binding protein